MKLGCEQERDCVILGDTADYGNGREMEYDGFNDVCRMKGICHDPRWNIHDFPFITVGHNFSRLARNKLVTAMAAHNYFELACTTDLHVTGETTGEAFSTMWRIVLTLVTVSIVSSWRKGETIRRLMLFFAHWLRCVHTSVFGSICVAPPGLHGQLIILYLFICRTSKWLLLGPLGAKHSQTRGVSSFVSRCCSYSKDLEGPVAKDQQNSAYMHFREYHDGINGEHICEPRTLEAGIDNRLLNRHYGHLKR